VILDQDDDFQSLALIKTEMNALLANYLICIRRFWLLVNHTLTCRFLNSENNCLAWPAAAEMGVFQFEPTWRQ